MMKRILSLALCLLMLCTGLSQAESDPYALLRNALYRIVLRTEEGDVTLGSGVLFMNESVLLTAESCCLGAPLYAIGEDGEHAIVSCTLAGESGAALLEMAEPSTGTPLTLANYDVESLPYLFGCDAEGNLGALPMYLVRHARYRGQNALTLSGEEGLLPGGIMADAKGCIVGLIMAQQMEGYGMYTALEPDTLYLALTGGADAAAFLPMTAAWEDGLLRFTWTDDERGKGKYSLSLSVDDNSYYTTYEIQPGERGVQMAVPPGHTYYAQVQWVDAGQEAQPVYWAAMINYTLPTLDFTQHGFAQRCYLAAAPAGEEVTGLLDALAPITAAALSEEGSDLYLQVINTYDVDGEITLPMTVSLVAPDGQVYFEEMSYIFSPEYEQNDTFAVPVDELFAACRAFSGKGSYPAGEYALRYSIGGRAAGEYNFTLEDEQ